MNPYSTQLIEQDDIDSVIKALQGENLTQGKLTKEFEEKIADFIGVKYALAFNSATSALYAAYKAYFKPGDLVITTPLSFVATANMMLENNLEPIFIDIDYSGNLSTKNIKAFLENLDSSVKAKIKGIVSVDFGGNSVEVEEFRELAKNENLVWISDSSHAFGASINNQKVGFHADSSIFSFHAIKPITTCEGGALVSNDLEVIEKAKLIRSHGVVKKSLWNSQVESSGFNFRMNEIQAALGLSQLKKVNRFLETREENAKKYDEIFKDNPFFSPLHSYLKPNRFSSNHLYPILLRKELYCAKEDIFKAFLDSNLGVQVHYKPISEYKLFENCLKDEQKTALDFYKAELSLVLHQKMNLDDVKKYAQTTLNIFEKFGKVCNVK